MLANSGPRMKRNTRRAGRVILLEHVGAGDVRRHEVGRELDAVEAEVEHLGERRDEQRLGQPGHADEQAVAAREQRREQLIDHRLLADDALLHLGLDLDARARDLLDGAQVGWGLGYHGLILTLLMRRTHLGDVASTVWQAPASASARASPERAIGLTPSPQCTAGSNGLIASAASRYCAAFLLSP